jgi:outer membrane receptor for ferrienterochelin and colicin
MMLLAAIVLAQSATAETVVRDQAATSTPGAERVTRADLEAFNANNAADAVSRLAGVDVQGSSLKRDRAERISLRGLDPRYTLVLVDGERLVGDDGAVDLSAIPPELIERIDVFKGPQAVLLGGDAMGGVVNVVTKKKVKQPRLEGLGRYGSFRSATASVTGQTRLGSSDLTAAARFERSDGWTDAVEVDRDLRQATPRSDPRGTDKGAAQVSFTQRPAEGHEVRSTARVTGALTHRDQQLEKYVERGTRVGQQAALGLDGDVAWRWNIPSRGQLESSLRVLRQAQTRDETSALALRQSGRDVGTTLRTVDEGWVHWLVNARTAWKYGVERHTFSLVGQARYERRDAHHLARNEARDVTGLPLQLAAVHEPARTFAKDELFGSLAVLESFRVTDAIDWDVGGRVDASTVWGAFVSPSTSLTVRPTAWLSVSGKLGRGHKMPSFDARTRAPTPTLDANGTKWLAGNPDLRPEAAWSADLSAEVKPGKRFSLAITGFGALVTDKLQKVVVENYNETGLPLEREANVGRVRSVGVEASMRAQPIDGLTLFTNVTWLQARNQDLGTPLDRVAPLIVNGGAQWTVPRLASRLSLNARYTAARPRVDGTGAFAIEGPEPALLWLDARIDQPLGPHLDVFAEAFNLSNTTWDRDGDGDSDLPPFHLFVGLRARL